MAEEDLLCCVTKVAFFSFQGSFPGNLQLVLVLRPTTLLQRTLSDILFKFNKDEFKMKVPVCTAILTSGITVVYKFNSTEKNDHFTQVLRCDLYFVDGFQVIMLSSITELHSYIDRTQLTKELGGMQEYCHEMWIAHRTVCTKYKPCD